jgi:hypothetical protein
MDLSPEAIAYARHEAMEQRRQNIEFVGATSSRLPRMVRRRGKASKRGGRSQA